MKPEGKEYGKLTADQFRKLISKSPEIKALQQGFTNDIKSRSKERFDELFSKNFYWSLLYELPFSQHVLLLIAALDKGEFVKNAAQAPDPQQVVLDEIDKDSQEEWTGGYGGYFGKEDLIGLAVSVQKTLTSIQVYQRSLSALVEEVRQGNDQALFDAVRVDRTIVACPTIASRISKAELCQDRKFFLRLRNSLKGLSGKYWARYNDLRFALFVLRECGLTKLSDEELEKLFVHDLKVYENNPNARRNLRKLYAESRKIPPT